MIVVYKDVMGTENAFSNDTSLTLSVAREPGIFQTVELFGRRAYSIGEPEYEMTPH